MVKNHLEHTPHCVFHHGLIKLLIDEELEKKESTWTHFLLWLGFKVENPTDTKLQGKEIPMKFRSYSKRKKCIQSEARF